MRSQGPLGCMGMRGFEAPRTCAQGGRLKLPVGEDDSAIGHYPPRIVMHPSPPPQQV